MTPAEKEEIREIIREELIWAMNIWLDAKTTATAMEKGLFYQALGHAPSTLRSKPVPQYQQSS